MRSLFLRLLPLLVLFPIPSWAIAIDIPPGQWQCMAMDNLDRNYGGYGKNMKKARQAARIACRKRSKNPRSCKTGQSFCEQGPVSLIENRCLVTDEFGRAWNTTGQDACRTAMYLCQQWQYLHGSTRSQCSVKHRMRNYDSTNDN